MVNGFEGGYQYRRLQVSGERYEDKPLKDRYSHIHDAMQYLMLGAGEGRQVLGMNKPLETFNARSAVSTKYIMLIIFCLGDNFPLAISENYLLGFIASNILA